MTDPTERWRISNVVRELDHDDDAFVATIAAQLGVLPRDLSDVEIVRRSIDARGRRAPRFVHVVDVSAPAGAVHPRDPVRPAPGPRIRTGRRVDPDAARPIVIGMGPCGLFAAMQLVEAGLRPVLLDRGREVELRAKDVAALMGRGVIDPESNLCFGEGGAGTWSDGKLYTRVGGELVRDVLERFVALGAPDRILVDGRPHMGTDRLVALLKAFRAALIDRGCDLRFDARVDRLELRDGAIAGVRLDDGELIEGSHVVLAVGHSARDVYRRLAADGVAMEPKAFAVGFRIEHRQAAIDEIQYGRWAGHEGLPAAYYEITTNLDDGDVRRGIYSFCMCPGGSVVPTPTREGEVCVNGMSHAARSGRYANSAVVVTVEPSDVAAAARGDDPIEQLLSGMSFPQDAAAAAWRLGGGAFVAPAQRAVDFVAGQPSSDVRRTTYKRGVNAAPLATCYPAPITAALREALRRFDRRMPGYLSDDAVLIGVETRTSAPVRILRDATTCESPSVSGLYPAGEGAGFGGGIVSAAIDGIRVADALLDGLGATACDGIIPADAG